jgi:hypothetical protein
MKTCPKKVKKNQEQRLNNENNHNDNSNRNKPHTMNKTNRNNNDHHLENNGKKIIIEMTILITKTINKNVLPRLHPYGNG